MELSVAGPVAGLFGKLPAHGDFVRRGWSDETVGAVDRWLSEAMVAARATRNDEDFAAWMRAAPLWRCFVPAGGLGPLGLHLGIAPSIDRAGRLFPIAAGVAGDDTTAWAHAGAAGQAVDAVIYDALTGRIDADATVMAIAATLDPPRGGAAPQRSTWWLHAGGEPALESETVDADLLQRLFGEGQA